MRETINITSKGQVTLPIEMRRVLGVAEGGKLTVHYDNEQQQLIVARPITFSEIRDKTAKYLRPNFRPKS